MMGGPTGKRFFFTLDGIRGVAALLVVVWHTTAFFDLSRQHSNALAVDIFFVLSGVVVANAYEAKLAKTLSLKDFALIRLIRLYPLYIFGTAISIIAISLRIGTTYGARDFALLVAFSIFFIPNPIVGSPAQMFPLNFPAWSLFFELLSNFIYAATVRFLNNRAILGIMLITAGGLLLFVHILPDHDLDIGFTVRSAPAGICRSFYSFFTGVFLFRIFKSRKLIIPLTAPAQAIMPWVIIATLATLLLSYPAKRFVPYYDFACVTLAFPTLVYVALYCEPTGAGARLCKFLGVISYPLYAVHDPLLHIVENIASHLDVNPAYYAPWFGFGFMIGAVIIAWALNKIYDLPIRQRLSQKMPISTKKIAPAELPRTQAPS